MESFILILAGLIVGSIITFLIVKIWFSKNYVPATKYGEIQAQLSLASIATASMLTKEEVYTKYVSRDMHDVVTKQLSDVKANLTSIGESNSNLQNRIVELTAQSEQKLSRSDVDESYRPKESYDLIHTKLASAEDELQVKESRILQLTTELTELQQREEQVKDKLTKFNEEIQSLHSLTKEQFRNLATDILEEKKKLFVETNKSEMTTLLGPFQKDMSDFKEKVEKTRADDIRDLTSLKKEIESLQKLNNELSEDAKNLAHALKADVKLQGSWGEDRLNMILETEGLQKYIDYTREEMYRDNEQEKNRKPDFILKLPNGKYIVIDSKVSLNAYVEYHNAETIDERTGYLKQHSKSITDHIDKLADKNYQTLAGLNTPDFVFMFVPIESALTLALNNAPDLFNYALKKKIILITPSTFVASMKIVKLLWAKENQVKNVEEIFRQAGELYNKFVSFLEFMDKIEDGLNIANRAHHDAMYALKDGSKKGATIIGRFETIRTLEAKVNKRIPDKHLSEINLSIDTDFEISEGPALPSADKHADDNKDISARTEI